MKSVGLAGLVFLVGILFNTAVNAEIYKWVDENGKVHYSDRKIDTAAQKVNVTTGATTLGNNDQEIEQRLLQQQKYVNYLQSERLERQEKRQEIKQAEEKKRKVCAKLQDQLKSYFEGRYRWYELDKSTGERKYLSDDQIETKKQALQAELKSNC